MTEVELQAIKERAKYATDGPWKVVKSEDSGVQIGTAWEHGQLKAGVPIVTTAHGVGGATVYINHVNAEFIAHAREDVPALIAEVERYKNVYEICERGMFKAHDMYKEVQKKLDRTELAEAKARMEIERLEIKVKNQAAQLIEYQKSFGKMKDQKRTVERMAYNRKQTIKQLRSLVGKLQKQLKAANRARSVSE